MTTVRWNIAASPEADQSVRMFIAAQGGGRKGDRDPRSRTALPTEQVQAICCFGVGTSSSDMQATPRYACTARTSTTDQR